MGVPWDLITVSTNTSMVTVIAKLWAGLIIYGPHIPGSRRDLFAISLTVKDFRLLLHLYSHF